MRIKVFPKNKTCKVPSFEMACGEKPPCSNAVYDPNRNCWWGGGGGSSGDCKWTPEYHIKRL